LRGIKASIWSHTERCLVDIVQRREALWNFRVSILGDLHGLTKLDAAIDGQLKLSPVRRA
jgi:hypothetical protein